LLLAGRLVRVGNIKQGPGPLTGSLGNGKYLEKSRSTTGHFLPAITKIYIVFYSFTKRHFFMNNTSELPQAGSHFISLNDGIDLTSRFRSNCETMLAPSFRDSGTLPFSETFNRYDIKVLLDKENCEAIRVYLGMDDSQQVRMLLVGVNVHNEDILPGPSLEGGGEDIVEEGHRCPDTCPPPSPLNGG
jgi:hypothetical protein